MSAAILEEVAKLSVEEKILLVERIWDEIAESSEAQSLEVSPELEAELERRWQLVEAGKTELFSWEEAQAIITRKK